MVITKGLMWVARLNLSSSSHSVPLQPKRWLVTHPPLSLDCPAAVLLCLAGAPHHHHRHIAARQCRKLTTTLIQYSQVPCSTQPLSLPAPADPDLPRYPAPDLFRPAQHTRSRAMQGVAAHDMIEAAEASAKHPSAEAARFAVGSPPRRLVARPREPENHGPSVIERELGEGLHPERNAQHGHPGVDCRSLPAAHAHRWGVAACTLAGWWAGGLAVVPAGPGSAAAAVGCVSCFPTGPGSAAAAVCAPALLCTFI